MKLTMCFLRTSIAASIIVGLLVSCKDSPPGPPPLAGPDTTSHEITWATDSMGFFSTRLLDVWGTSETNVYAVGYVPGPPPEPGTYIAQYNGSVWAPMQDDSLGWWLAAGLLAGIHGLSNDMIVVAGSRYNSGVVTGVVAKWNGARWTNISPDSSAALFTVWAESETSIYAAGDSGTILWYDGNSWTQLESGTDLDIWQISGLPGGEIYAVGSDYFNSFAGSVILRIEGNIVIHEQFFPVGQKFGIWGTLGGEAYATGEGTFHKTRGSSWLQIATPNPRVALWSVTGTAPNNVLVVGSYGAVVHWSGGSWRFYEELYDRSSFKSYFKTFAIGNRYFLVGYTGSRALMTVGTRIEP
jgi:hypothetical protein